MAAQNWIKNNSDIADIPRILSFVRLSEMSCYQLLNFVQPSGLLEQDQMSQQVCAKKYNLKMTLRDYTSSCKYMLFLHLDFNNVLNDTPFVQHLPLMKFQAISGRGLLSTMIEASFSQITREFYTHSVIYSNSFLFMTISILIFICSNRSASSK